MPSTPSSVDAQPGLRVRVDDRELDLLLVRVEVEEQLVDLVDHLADARVGAVDLVHHEHHRQAGLERLAEHEAGLGQRALGGVHEQHHAVDHRQPALHLAAEVRVARRVDEVQLHVAVAHGRVLGEDRDAALALLVHRVHDEVGEPLGLVGGEHAGLAQHGVDQRGLPVVDVGDDRDVADVRALGHGAPTLDRPSSSATGYVADVVAGTVVRPPPWLPPPPERSTCDGDPAAVRPLHGRLDALHADLQRAEAGDPLEGRVARDLDADRAALRVVQAEGPACALLMETTVPSYCVAAEAVATAIDMVRARAVMSAISLHGVHYRAGAAHGLAKLGDKTW